MMTEMQYSKVCHFSYLGNTIEYVKPDMGV
jgi:hypothetical protein